ncbi:hypothetical protein Aduo_007549 [Ancylostoma duodenale]
MPRKQKIKLKMCAVSNFIVDDTFLRPVNDEEVRRCVIIDAPNVMHITKTHTGLEKANSAGLLALMRYFVKNDFDVVAVTQRKYTLDATVTHKFAIERLEKMGLIHLVDGHEYDDIVALEIAFASDGVIVSNDQFTEHMQASNRYLRLMNRCISLELDAVAQTERYTMSSNGHCIAEHTFRFKRKVFPNTMNGLSASSILHEAFFSTPDNVRHELVEEHRQNWTEDYRSKVLGTIDELLAQIRILVKSYTPTAWLPSRLVLRHLLMVVVRVSGRETF